MACRTTRLVAAFVVLAVPLSAQDYTGTFAAQNQQGGQTVITMQQANNGQVTGTITGNGNTFQIAGVIEEGSVVGAMTGAQGGLWFEAELDEGELYLTLMEPDANGQPNYGTATTLVFARANAMTQAGAATVGNPLAGSGAGGGQDPWIGSFTDGSVVLQLQGGGGTYSGTVQVQGQSFPVSLSGSVSSLQGSFRAADGSQYAMELAQQRGAVVMASGGAVYTLQRSGGATAANPLAAGGTNYARPQEYGNPSNSGQQMGSAGGGGIHDGTQLGREWAEFLANKKATQMESYSSGSAGGYSSRTDVHFCANGQFVLSGNNSVSVDVGGAYGYTGGNSQGSGTWRILTQGQVAGIELQYANGGVEQYRLDYQDGATYVNGDRWYITPSEACGY